MDKKRADFLKRHVIEWLALVAVGLVFCAFFAYRAEIWTGVKCLLLFVFLSSSFFAYWYFSVFNKS